MSNFTNQHCQFSAFIFSFTHMLEVFATFFLFYYHFFTGFIIILYLSYIHNIFFIEDAQATWDRVSYPPSSWDTGPASGKAQGVGQ